MKQNPELHKKRLLNALKQTGGLITPAAQMVGLSRQHVYWLMKHDENFKKEVEDINEETLDFVESKLMEKIREGSEKSIHFYLKTKGKSRGYSDNVDITSNGETINTVSNINIKVVEPKKKD